MDRSNGQSQGAAGAVKRAESLLDLIAEEAPASEAARRVSDRVIGAVAGEGLFDLVVPTSLGGQGLGLDALTEVTRTLAGACPATAWTLSFLMLHAWLVSRLPAAGREELFAGDRVPFVPAPLAPSGRATPVDGGYLVNGRWEWATASAHADWVLVHALADGTPPTPRFFALPVDEVSIDDVWFTAGMRATSSNTVVVDNGFVPTHRSLETADLFGSTGAVAGDGMAGLPVHSILALVAAAPALGGAEAAAALYRRRVRDRVLAYSAGDHAVEQPAAQMRLAAVYDLVRTADARWHQAISALLTTPSPGPAERVDARLAASSTVRTARQAIALACEGAGASVYFESHPLQRIQRDVETLKGHVVFDWDRTTEVAGRFALGLELRPTDMV